MSEIRSKVIRLLSKISDVPGPDINGVTEIESLELDSIDNLDVMMQLEDEYDVEFDTSRFSTCVTVDDVVAEIERAIKTK